jgi:4-hydroxythreonine-4-phosphate dehydrogenase
MGDPQGIGPEIIHKSLREYRPQCAVIILGEPEYYADRSIQIISNIEEAKDKGVYFYNVNLSASRDSSYNYVRTGIEWALKKNIHALVTAPISKDKWYRAGIPYKGHTQLLAETASIENHCMFFWSENLKVALFTVHIPLKDIFQHIRQEKIIRFIRFVDSELTRLFKKKFTFLVNGLNPHAGENGIIGTEESDTIIPAINVLTSAHEIDIRGPYPPDTIFLKARNSKDSVVISWYHDQGLIAFKLLNIHSGVNMTLGLPYIRTAPDHGTAVDIAGKGIANPSSMKQAIQLAEYLLQLTPG